jgi:uncharacterized membrane protein
MTSETLFDFLIHSTPRTTFVLIGVLIVVGAFIISVLVDKRDDREDHESLNHSKSVKVGVLSILIGIMICLGIDFSGGVELILTGFSVIFLRQSIHRLRK